VLLNKETDTTLSQSPLNIQNNTFIPLPGDGTLEINIDIFICTIYKYCFHELYAK